MSDKWSTRFMQLAQLVATWSKDPSTKVGAVVVDSKHRVVSVGFNGFPAGTDDTEGSRERKLLRTVHAEVNAVSFAARSVEDCSLYSTHPPCAHCAGILIQHGIKEVYFPQVSNEFMLRWGESFDEAITMFSEAGVYFEELGSEPCFEYRIAKVIHYPEHWDTACYSTIDKALSEMFAWWKCDHESHMERKECDEEER